MGGSNDTEPLVSRKLVYRKVSSEVSGTTKEGSDEQESDTRLWGRVSKHIIVTPKVKDQNSRSGRYSLKANCLTVGDPDS